MDEHIQTPWTIDTTVSVRFLSFFLFISLVAYLFGCSNFFADIYSCHLLSSTLQQVFRQMVILTMGNTRYCFVEPSESLAQREHHASLHHLQFFFILCFLYIVLIHVAQLYIPIQLTTLLREVVMGIVRVSLKYF